VTQRCSVITSLWQTYQKMKAEIYHNFSQIKNKNENAIPKWKWKQKIFQN